MKDQKKAGIILSYFNIALNMCLNIFFTPFLMSSLGQAEYGLYRTIQSFAGQFVIMTFGMCTLVGRNIVYYDSLKQKKEKENFLAMALIISFILVAILLVIGGIAYTGIDNMFVNSFTAGEIETAKSLFVLFIVNVAVTILNDYFAGFLVGHERFVPTQAIKTINRLLRIVILIILLKLKFNSVAIIATDLALSAVMLAYNLIYGIFVLKEKIRFYYLDTAMLRTTLLFSGAILLQAVINQVNQNMDSLILGIMTDTKTVAMYSIALTIYTTYNGITTTVSGVFAPKATRMIASGASNKELTDLVSRTGRYQFMFAGAILGGFVLFGKNFIKVWVGEAFLPAYTVTLILIIPMTIPLIQSVSNSILDALLKRMARSLILVGMAVINVVLSVILIKFFGYIGAAYGTALSVIIGHIIIMNIYLNKVIGLDTLRMFKDIFDKILPCILASMLLSIPLSIFLPDTFTFLIVKISVFLLIYALLLYKFGMNSSERSVVLGMAKLKRNN